MSENGTERYALQTVRNAVNWLQSEWLERLTYPAGGQEVAGSSPVAPTNGFGRVL